ncbi:MAG: VCBS repeat-containing protein [Aureispira sp.]|nr:VCBS repeat-containing protein [Aureispira sp.]
MKHKAKGIVLLGSCFFFLTVILSSCKQDIELYSNGGNTEFTLVPASHSNIDFVNTIEETQKFNFLSYPYIYNGGGVSIGDINNDGLDDIFLSSNQGSNKLYLNKGNLSFEDISAKAGVEDPMGWTTGVSMIDINNDGWLDIYICKSGLLDDPKQRENKLFINNKDNTFTDKAKEYNLNDPSFSTQAYFFDFDNDNDLDIYLVNHRIDFKNNSTISSEIQNDISLMTSDKLFINNDSKFTNIATNGLNKTWGLSASIADFNNDGWYDIYVCNDFLEPDHLFMNIPNGGVKDEILNTMDHLSFYSMGSDVADINNDSKLDLMILDMSPADHGRSKRNMASMNVGLFNKMGEIGYHQQYMSNVLQLNRGNQVYSEIAQFAGVSKTDWSWASLLVDLDNDGLKDIYITNGIRRDVTENDLKPRIRAKQAEVNALGIEDVLGLTNSERLQNRLYINQGNTKFKDKSVEWGMTKKSFSNGAAYGDLDNDGDLDLVVNNIDNKAFLYQNNSTNNYVSIKLKGGETNRDGIGSTIEVFTKDVHQTYQHFLNRGFQSSMSPKISIGLNHFTIIDSLKIKWYNGKSETMTDVKSNQLITLDIENASDQIPLSKVSPPQLMAKYSNESLNGYSHSENVYVDFEKEILLPQKQSSHGPKSCIGDVNNDGLDDCFITGSKGFSAVLLIQNKDQSFSQSNNGVFEKDKAFEDTGCMLIDVDNDGDLDLYVVSGGNEFEENSPMLQDRLYINDGAGNFKKESKRLPKMITSGCAVAKGDYDGDGDVDIFVGGRIIPGKYPLAPTSYLLENDNGFFQDITETKSADLQKIGLVTDALFSDYDNDDDLDLLVVGEWMSPTVFVNNGNSFEPQALTDEVSNGWWYSISSGDLNNDGSLDYFIGNLGENNKFKVKKDKALHLYASDFDSSGNVDIVLANEAKKELLPLRGRECSSEQMPFIKDKFPDYKSFSEAGLSDIYTEEKLENALHLTASDFTSVLLLGKGDGKFSKSKLPNIVQYGPTLSSKFLDVNNDGLQDIVGAGNIYETEPETVAYDASKGYVLINDGTGKFIEAANHDFLLKGNIKDVQIIKIGDQKILLAFQNNGPIQSFKLE